MVSAIGHIDIASAVDCQAIRVLQLAGAIAHRAEETYERAVRGELLNPPVIRVRDKDISRRISRDSTWEIELSAGGAFSALEHRDGRDRENLRAQYRGVGPLQLLRRLVWDLVNNQSEILVRRVLPHLG